MVIISDRNNSNNSKEGYWKMIEYGFMLLLLAEHGCLTFRDDVKKKREWIKGDYEKSKVEAEWGKPSTLEGISF